MKKKIVSLALAVCLLAIAAVGTLAYFTDKTETKENTFTVGNVSIELTEPNWESSGKVDAPEVYAGEALAKDPTVTNDGANPCFVRVKVTGLDCLGTDKMIQYRNASYELGKLNENWVDGGDGYFYYTKVLDKDTSTNPVFSSIVMPTGLTNGDAKTAYSVDVFAEAVQAQGAQPSWSAVQVMTAEQIIAWFGTVMG